MSVWQAEVLSDGSLFGFTQGREEGEVLGCIGEMTGIDVPSDEVGGCHFGQ